MVNIRVFLIAKLTKLAFFQVTLTTIGENILRKFSNCNKYNQS